MLQHYLEPIDSSELFPREPSLFASRTCDLATSLCRLHLLGNLFPTKTTGTSLVFGRVKDEMPLILESRMAENGVIFNDGIEKDFLEFNSGTQAVIGIAERQSVLVI